MYCFKHGRSPLNTSFLFWLIFKSVFFNRDPKYISVMSTRLYPLFQKGNPQLRIFLPNFWMKIIRPKEPLPPNMVLFQTSIEMTDYDVRNYLEKIYRIPVVEVRTTIKQGVIRTAYGKNYLVKDDDYKEALVTMPRKLKFIYPDIVPKTEDEAAERKKMEEEAKKLDPPKKAELDFPDWFK